MRAAIVESSGKLQRVPQQQSAAAHRIAGIAAGLAHHRDGAGCHPRTAVVARVAFDQDRAAAHVVAGAFADIAFDQDRPPFIPILLPGTAIRLIRRTDVK